MDRKIIDRYRHSEDGRRIIDISAAKVSDLYDDFDKQAPFIKKELDYDLVEYLIESARELGTHPFKVIFTFHEPVTEERQERVQTSVYHYFDYLGLINHRELIQLARSSATLIVLGTIMLVASIYMGPHQEAQESIVKKVVSEGMVIAAWISIWEGATALLMELTPLIRTRKVYARLLQAEVAFQFDPS